MITTQIAISGVWGPVLPGIAMVIAILVATSVRPSTWAAAPLIAVAAFSIGLDSGVESGGPFLTVCVTLLATWLSVNICVVNFAYYTSLLPSRKWVQIGVRIAGSWIAAITLMVLAFALKTK